MSKIQKITLVVLDFLGTERTIIGVVVSSLALMATIVFGLAFGKALEDNAKEIVVQIKKHPRKE